MNPRLRIIAWLAGLSALAVLIVAAPMHPALRVSLAFIAFWMVVAAVVEFVNRGKGPDIVPGSKGTAQLSVDLDQLAARLAEWQERASIQDAGSTTAIERLQMAAAAQDARIDAAIEQLPIRIRSEVDASLLRFEAQINEITERFSSLGNEVVQANVYKTKERIGAIEEAASDVVTIKEILPDLEAVLMDWREEKNRPPSSRSLAARDNFLDEKTSSVERLVDRLKPFLDTSGFNPKIDARTTGRQLTDHGQLQTPAEIKSWTRSQTKVEAIEKTLSTYLIRLKKMTDLAERILTKSDRAGDIAF